MTTASSWMRYSGDGRTAEGRPTSSPGAESGRYLADPKLVTAVNTALAVEQPILVTGEAGTGKTTLAWSIASELELGSVLEFHTRSDHQARDTLYTVDYLRRFYHAQRNDPRAEDFAEYVRFEALGQAIDSPRQRVVLIDEIDKAPRDFPNDLLNEIDRMKFTVTETGKTYESTHRPVVVITSNSERQLPDPFLRRCVFHRIEFPTGPRLEAILSERLAHLGLAKRLIEVAVARFEQIRGIPGWDKKPATAELIAWVRVLQKAGIEPETLSKLPLGEVPFHGTLAKTEQDSQLLERSRA